MPPNRAALRPRQARIWAYGRVFTQTLSLGAPSRPKRLPGSGGFELANVVLRSMLNSFRNCRLIPERLAARDLSRASCRKADVYLLAELAPRPPGEKLPSAS